MANTLQDLMNIQSINPGFAGVEGERNYLSRLLNSEQPMNTIRASNGEYITPSGGRSIQPSYFGQNQQRQNNQPQYESNTELDSQAISAMIQSNQGSNRPKYRTEQLGSHQQNWDYGVRDKYGIRDIDRTNAVKMDDGTIAYAQRDGRLIGQDREGRYFEATDMSSQNAGFESLQKSIGEKLQRDYAQALKDEERKRQQQSALATDQLQQSKPTFSQEQGGYVYPPNQQNPQGRFVPVQGMKPQSQVKINPTIQKEVFQADEGAQAAQNVQGLLGEALKLNDLSYSGYGAKGRAVLRSNLPWDSQEADATVNLDNIMTGQALESLKSIFGGMPTEGERKILLDMQASADKTPAQRRDIIARAQAAAARRMKFNQSKAQALRAGGYFDPSYSPLQQDQGGGQDIFGAADAILNGGQ